MLAAIEHLRNELHSIRTGRANPVMVSNVKVNIYGAEMRLHDIAGITAPEARQLLISPYDQTSTQPIAKAIQESNLGYMPHIDGHIIRINIPPMDDNLRKKMIKTCHEYTEQTLVVIRGERQAANKAIRKDKDDKKLPEDSANKLEKEVQILTDKYSKVAKELCDSKEQEVSKI